MLNKYPAGFSKETTLMRLYASHDLLFAGSWNLGAHTEPIQKCIHYGLSVRVGAHLKKFQWLFITLPLGFAVFLIIIWMWSDQNL